MTVLRVLTVAGLLIGALLTGLGFLAHWWPALDIVNNSVPFVAIGSVLFLCPAALLRDWRLIIPAALLTAINAVLFLAAWQAVAAEAAPGSPRFIRVATFNLWHGNNEIEHAAKFLAETDADLVVLQEVTPDHAGKLQGVLGARYPHRLGETGLVILSKHPIVAEGRVDRPSYPPWVSPMLRWARLDIGGTTFEFAGVHFARPFYPTLEQQDVASLIQFVQSRSLPLVVAGDFNMSPWTEKLARFEGATGLRRYNTVHPTWPMRWHCVPLLPLVPTDNIFASPRFAKIATDAGPRLGSDHRPVIADVALVEH